MHSLNCGLEQAGKWMTGMRCIFRVGLVIASVSAFATGAAPAGAQTPGGGACAPSAGVEWAGLDDGPQWNGWGAGVTNTRFPAGGACPARGRGCSPFTAQVGLRIREIHRGADAAGGGRRPSVRGE